MIYVVKIALIVIAAAISAAAYGHFVARNPARAIVLSATAVTVWIYFLHILEN